MAESLRFYSCLQRGLALSLGQEADQYGRPTQANNNISFGVRLKGDYEDIHQNFEIRGPADVIGLQQSQIHRTEPKPNTPDFEPNFFPFIEFKSAELPWAYSFTNKSNSGRLRPWLALVVLEQQADYQFSATGHGNNGILSIKSEAGTLLPDLEQLFAWAHVQQSGFAGSAANNNLSELYKEQPESFISRLVCPVRLKRNTSYQAFLVPCFEAGRLAGLGQDVDVTNYSDAWAGDTQSLDLPVYYQWSFMTANADLEELLRRLTPFPADETIGLKDLDLSNPRGGLDVQQLGNLPQDAKEPIVSFKGALTSPIAKPKKQHPRHKKKFEQKLTETLLKKTKKPDDKQNYDPLEHDPVVTPPVYGRWQNPVAVDKTQDLPTWMSEANLSPDQRAISGVGADVIRLHQEDYMAKAWEHARNVRDIQIELQKARLAVTVSEKVHKNIAKLSDEALLQLSNNMHRKLSATTDKKTIFYKIKESAFVPTGVTDSQMRRQSARQHKVLRKLYPQNNSTLEAGKISGKVVQACIQPTQTIKKLAQFKPSSFMSYDVNYEAQQTVQSATGSPKKKKVVLADTYINIPISAASFSAKATLPVSNGSATEEGSVNKDLNLRTVAQKIRVKTNPKVNVQKDVYGRISGLSPTSSTSVPIPKFADVPLEFDEAVYKKLQAMNPEFLLPGFGAIPDNSASILSVNPKFIESYLMGLNHEMSRELAWRDYPARLNGTWFKKFWDYIGKPNQKDIGNIHEWKPKSKLGKHAYGFEPGSKESRTVLLVKGDLLRRYPNLVVYAVQANWKPKRTIKDAEWTVIDPSAEMKYEDITRYADVARAKTEMPVFRGKISDNAHFLGFNLDIKELTGSVEKGDERAGWFFVFEEHVSEPRFGLDMAVPEEPWAGVPSIIQDFSWNNVAENQEDLDGLSHLTIDRTWLAGKKIENVKWGENSAQMARLTYQNPVRVMFHADALIHQGED